MKGSLCLHFTLANLCWIIFLKPRTYSRIRRQRKRQQVYLVTSAITPPYYGPVCMQRSIPSKPCNHRLCPVILDLSGIVTTQQDKVWGFQTEQAVSRAWFSLSLHWPSPQLGWTLRVVLPWRHATWILCEHQYTKLGAVGRTLSKLPRMEPQKSVV